MKKKPLLALLSLAAASLLLAGCFDSSKPTRVAGGDDYPNGVEPLGKKAAQVRGDSSDWNGFDSVPRSGPGLYDTTHVPDSVPDTSKSGSAPAPLPKRMAPASPASAEAGATGPLGGLIDTLTTHVIDTAKGVVEAVRTQVTDSTRRVESTVFVPADAKAPGSKALVSQVAGRVTRGDSGAGLFEAWRFADADGDGVLSPQAGSSNRADIELIAGLPGGVVEKTARRIAAGADLDFNARGDNLLVGGSFLRTLAGDTVDLFTYADADGDSLLIDFARDTNLVDLVEEHRFASGNPVVSVTRKVRIVVHSEGPEGNYPLAYSERRVFGDDAVLQVAARGLGPDSALRPGADARWAETLAHASADSVERSERVWTMRLAAAAGDFRGNRLVGFTLDETHRRDYRGFHFDFRCEAPVADGRWIANGDVTAGMTLSDGDALVFSGTAISSGMRGRLTDGKGEFFSIAFDRAGAIVSKP